MNKRSATQVSFSYSLLVGAITFVIPYLTVVALLLYIFATELDPVYWQALTSLLVFVPAFWLIDARWNGWSKVIMYIIVLAITVAAMFLIPEYGVWEIRQILLYVCTFIAARALLAYLSLSKIPYHKAIAEFAATVTQIIWALAGYWIITNRVPDSTQFIGLNSASGYLLVNVVSVFTSTIMQVVVLIWRNTKLSNMVEKLKLVSTWSLDEHVVEHMLAAETEVANLKPAKRAVMFGDIRGFTAFSEAYYAERVVEVLNEMYHIVDEIVLKFGGAKPEFIADEFITYFSDSQVAVDCGVEIAKAVNSSLNKYDLGMGIGIDYGGILEGVLGSQSSKKYTVIGSHVNTAARLQSKAESGEILISKDVREQIEGYKVRLKTGLQLKGVSSDLRVYSLKYSNQPHEITVKKVSWAAKLLRILNMAS